MPLGYHLRVKRPSEARALTWESAAPGRVENCPLHHHYHHQVVVKTMKDCLLFFFSPKVPPWGIAPSAPPLLGSE